MAKILEQINLYQKLILGNKKGLFISLMFPILATIIVVWIAGKHMFVNYEDTKSATFVIVSAAIWGGVFNTIQTVVSDRKAIKFDLISSNVNAWQYSFSRSLLQFLLCLIQSLILTSSYLFVKLVYGHDYPKHGIWFSSTLLEIFISIFLIMYSSDIMGFVISSLVRKAETANVLAPYILIIELIFSGIFFDMSGFTAAISKTMISRWGMAALGSITRLNTIKLKIQKTVPTVPHKFEGQFKASIAHLRLSWLILLIFIVVFLVIFTFFVSRIKYDKQIKS